MCPPGVGTRSAARDRDLLCVTAIMPYLALVTNVPHYAEARRSRVPCQLKPSGCYQPIPGLIVPYPFRPFREQPILECVGVVPTSGRSRQGSAAAAVPAYPAAKLLCQGSAATVAIMIPQFKVRGLSLLGQVAACPHLMPFAKGPPSYRANTASIPSFELLCQGSRAGSAHASTHEGFNMWHSL